MKSIKITNNYHLDRNENISRYFTDVRHLSKVKSEQPVEDRTPEELVKTHLKFAISIAKKYLHRGIPFEDLVQYANIALINAANHFDPTRGFQFSSYCVMAIRKTILSALRKSKIGISCNHHDEKQINDLRLFSDKISQENNYFYSLDELKAMYPELFNQTVSDYLAMSNYSYIESEEDLGENDIDIYDKQDLQYRIQKLISLLTKQEQIVIKYLYFEGYTMYDVAEKLDLTRERIRQIHVSAIRKMKLHKNFLKQ